MACEQAYEEGLPVSSFTFAAAGDAIIMRRCTHRTDAAFRDLIQVIQQADAAFVNIELVTPRPPLVPSSEYGGLHLAAPEYVLDELRAMGFTLFNVATNHAVDYTYQGLVDTMDALAERGMVFAGGGRNLGEARSPGYLETAAGRVGLVAMASSYVTGALAAASRTDMPGRPGLNPLRVEAEYVLDTESLAALTRVDEVLGTAAVNRRRKRFGSYPVETGGTLQFLGAKFVAGEAPGVRTRPHRRDLDEICTWIGDARRQSEFVVASLHAHEGIARDSNTPELADFIPEAAHAFIDAGADVFVGHGPHMLRPFEVYKGKPVFYSLGNFFYEVSGIKRYPAEGYERFDLGPGSTPADVMDWRDFDKQSRIRGQIADERFWQSVVAVCRFDDWTLSRIDLYPVELSQSGHRARRGTPQLADKTTGRAILERLATASAPFGFHISIEDQGERVVGRASWR